MTSSSSAPADMGSCARSLLGSVSREVVARSPVPVLVARGPRDESRHTPALRVQPEVRAERSTAAVSMSAEPIARGALAAFLWLVAALLLELEVAWWIFDRMYAP
jgi:hypothetical protein